MAGFFQLWVLEVVVRCGSFGPKWCAERYLVPAVFPWVWPPPVLFITAL